jgi:hypothetical protein
LRIRVVEKNKKKHILYSKTFFSEKLAADKIMSKKYDGAMTGHRWQRNTARALCMLDN